MYERYLTKNRTITVDADKFTGPLNNPPFAEMILYRETAMRVLEEHLRPCEAVIESLEVSGN